MLDALRCRWEVYTPHESVLSFAITVSINATNATINNAAAVSSLTLSPAVPRAVSSDKRVLAQLVGDLAPYRAYPVLTSQRLLMPTLTSLSLLRPAEWLLVDPSMITLDGSECNKIGVGFSAFRCAQLARTMSCPMLQRCLWLQHIQRRCSTPTTARSTSPAPDQIAPDTCFVTQFSE
jgi:Male gamete fusion factor